MRLAGDAKLDYDDAAEITILLDDLDPGPEDRAK